eukprot:TRINITY_DN4071_c0_g1_i1.p1 TRINITY_DN4071_c0_g1~~TRINITY_DN4071_c0_g1_i1.p1  ORF type:complete len:409 (-),score=100.58 TRINITY_DN4071_c0_g1_i1:223-1449(-)
MPKSMQCLLTSIALLSAADATKIHMNGGSHVAKQVAAVQSKSLRQKQGQKQMPGAPAAAMPGGYAASPMASPMAAPAASPMGAEMNFGNSKCPCVGIAGIEGVTIGRISKNTTASFPADLGARCEAWDNGYNTLYCADGGDPGKNNGWCAQPWCYVDPCNCDLDVPPTQSPDDSGYLPGASYQGNGMWYSYKTCGGIDFWLDADKKKEQQEQPKTCEEEKDEAVWGNEDCKCIGIAGQAGTTNVTISPGLEMPYPADTGATCQAWDQDRHPDCKKDKPPDWCSQSWCYVDPCSCKIATPPKTSAYLPEAQASGLPIYYSYATCGGVDAFAAGNEKACVNQKSKNSCEKNNKCAWNGVECLGYELVEVCGLQSEPSAKKPKTKHAKLSPVAVLVLGLLGLLALIGVFCT